METFICILAALSGTMFAAGLTGPARSDLFEVDLLQLSDAWERERVSPRDPYSLKHVELKARLQKTAQEGFARVEEIGRSVEGREIFMVTVGAGTEKILLWSQMHGDEPTATSSLLDLLEFFRRHRDEPWVAAILRKYTLQLIPMLNPDGAERNQRRNSQGIDINRDARALQTPEGRTLKRIRDIHKPFLGFNLHNQNATTTVGDTGKVATIALLAVAADSAGPGTSATPLARQVTAVLYEALSPFVYGHISRYDERFNPRAFGDNITLWGTPVVLIESGGIPAGAAADVTVKLNFVGLLAVFDSLATGRIARSNPAVFDSLRMNSDSPIFDLMLRDAWIFTGTGLEPFRGDIAVRRELRAGAQVDAIVADLGDLAVHAAHRTVDCSGLLVTPGLIAFDRTASALAPGTGDIKLLRKGITTVVEPVDLAEVLRTQATPDVVRARRRAVNWGYVVRGRAPIDDAANEMMLAEWLARGGRGWLQDTATRALFPARTGRIPSWFGTQSLSDEEIDRHAMPGAVEGPAARSLLRFASEAAVRFGFPQRGTISPGAVADLVIWKGEPGRTPEDLAGWRPIAVFVNGREIDFEKATPEPPGRFLER